MPNSPHDLETCLVCQTVKMDAVAMKLALPAKETDEQDAAKLIREKLLETATTCRGKEHGTITLQTGGRPMTIEVKPPNDQPAKTATSDSLACFMKEQGYSLRQMQTLQKYLRGTYGKKSVEPKSHDKLVKTTHCMDDFLEAYDQEFVEKENKVLKPVKR